jgi:hypothetical protein
MGAVGVGAILVGVFALIVAGFVWQRAAQSAATEQAEYVIPDAVAFVYNRLSDRALGGLDPDGVRRVLEWNLHFTQVIGPRRLGRLPVIGSGEGMEYVLDRARAAGVEIEPIDVAEVMGIETDYLLSIGAIGAPVEGKDA